MFLRANKRFKDGKEHRYWSVVENRRVAGGRSVQKTLLYLGEINDSDRAAWTRAIEAVDEREQHPPDSSLPGGSHARSPTRTSHAQAPPLSTSNWPVHANGAAAGLHWNSGTAWISMPSGNRSARLPKRHALAQGAQNPRRLSPARTRQRVETPPSWFDRSAMADLLHDDFRLAAIDTLYRCHDRLLDHREALFIHLKERWSGLFGASYDILLYDLTSTYFEVDANGPVTEASKLKAFGYSRDKRPDCVQIVIALIITPDGLPIGYEVMRGNTSDKTTLAGMLKKITDRYGKERRTWIMDRGIPTEETLGQMRHAAEPLRALPRGHPERPSDQTGKRPRRQGLAGGQRRRPCQTPASRRRTLRAGPQPAAPRQGERDAAQKTQSLLGTAQGTPKARQTHPRRIAAGHRSGQGKGRAQRAPARHPSSSRLWRASHRRDLPHRTGPRKNSRTPAATKASICCAATSPAKIPPNCGATT
jgi:hypothetical protein